MKQILFIAALLSVGLVHAEAPLTETADVPFIVGESALAFHAKPSTAPADAPNHQWFVNDHCFIEDKDGTLHWFGINNPYPPAGKDLYRYHPYVGHRTTTTPEGKWTDLPAAIDESKGTEYLGAPFVIYHDESDRYAMVVETWRGTRRLEVYWSKDLTNWEETKTPILPETLWVGSRDPQIIKGDDGKYWILVVSCGNKGVGQTQVLRIRTKDFVTFEAPETILGINDITWATGLESPFLVERNGVWYLFVTYAHRRYAETLVLVAKTSDHFNFPGDMITTLFGHAAEVITYKGKTYITSCGPEDKHLLNHQSMSIAPLKWLKQQ